MFESTAAKKNIENSLVLKHLLFTYFEISIIWSELI